MDFQFDASDGIKKIFARIKKIFEYKIHPSNIFGWCSRWLDIITNWMSKFIIWDLGCTFLILFALMDENDKSKNGK